LKVTVTGVDSGQLGKEYYLLSKDDGEPIGELVEDTFDSEATLTVTLSNGRVRTMPGTGDLADDMKDLLAKLFQEDIEIMLK